MADMTPEMMGALGALLLIIYLLKWDVVLLLALIFLLGWCAG